ncbi:nucleotidyltransferase domain-containing protein [Paracoccus litorisediminis]|uniref:nucleotidyltransferase domain-containing protein n=1 Tax=Paracoccus litorisediminis TaxID=2006130 RepID=UPI00373389D4
MTTAIEKIRMERARVRGLLLDAALKQVRKVCNDLELEFQVFGSYAESRHHGSSDLDIMILSEPDADTKRLVISKIESISVEIGVPVDVLFRSEAPELYLEIKHD